LGAQKVSPALHSHSPALQRPRPGQATPQAPQFSRSVVTSMHLPSHTASGVGHAQFGPSQRAAASSDTSPQDAALATTSVKSA